MSVQAFVAPSTPPVSDPSAITRMRVSPDIAVVGIETLTLLVNPSEAPETFIGVHSLASKVPLWL